MLETGCVYIVPLMESLDLPAGRSSASANPKSRPAGSTSSPASWPTTARSSTRSPAGYHGPLYLEICPRTFPIVVRAGSRLSQIRFRVGEPCSARRTAALHAAETPRGRRQRQHFRRRHRPVDRPQSGERAASSAIAASTIPASSTSTGGRPIDAARFLGADHSRGSRRTGARSGRILYPRLRARRCMCRRSMPPR